MFIICLGACIILNKKEKIKVGKYPNSTYKKYELKQDNNFFDDYLKTFLERTVFHKNVENFDDDYINTFLILNFLLNIPEGNHCKDTVCTYNFLKQDIDNVTLKYFNKKDFNVKGDEKLGIKKISSEIYQIYWTPLQLSRIGFKNKGVEYDGNNITVKYDVESSASTNYKGELTFYLTYNDGYFNINKTNFLKN